jgi:ribonuclease Z
MPTLHLLGTGAALSGPGRTTTMLALQGERSHLLVDCGGDAVERLTTAGVDLKRISALVLTHGHPDHVSGFPLLIQKLWLAKRGQPLPIRGPESALARARALLDCFDTSNWEGVPPLDWQAVEPREGAAVWSDGEWRITAAPGSHGRTPSIGIRAEWSAGGAVAHSSDTEPCSAIARLARGAAILVHEATGEFAGHSTAVGAARIAREAEAERLMLVHLPPEPDQADLEAARAVFPRLQLGTDGDALAF